LTGFVGDVKTALDNIREGGDAGKELISTMEGGEYKDIQIEKGNKNAERGGLITWDPTRKLVNVPNQDGSFGREPYLGLAHEIGHSWDRFYGPNDFSAWYTTTSGKVAKQSEKVATHWENRIRAENGLPLREFYSFDRDAKNFLVGEEKGRLLYPGTNFSTTQTMTIGSPPLSPMKIPYIY
jgi:hypothetical protein